MKPLSADERWALDVLAGPPAAHYGRDAERLASVASALAERGIANTYKHVGHSDIRVPDVAYLNLARRVDDAYRASRT